MKTKVEIEEEIRRTQQKLDHSQWQWDQVMKHSRGKDQDLSLKLIGSRMDKSEIHMKTLKWVLQ